jgi:thiol:disulfide interchange protein/DsbC/DsbD-like thiol-disulfide interchange protein
MPLSKTWVLCISIALPAVFAASGGRAATAGATVVATDNVTARLVSEVRSVAPGESFWVALEFNIREGWHTYWRNPGDSGKATTLAWDLPAGFTAGEIVWAAPHRFELPPLVNYGYAKHAMHLVKIDSPRDLQPGVPVSLHAKASWLVCADLCIPESADLQLNLAAGAAPGAMDPATAALFAAARSEVPIAAPAATTARIQGDRLVLTLGREWGKQLSKIKSLSFFPYADGSIEYAAPQTLARGPASLELELKVGYQPPANGPVRGLLIATQQDGAATADVPLEISARLEGAGAAATSPSPLAAAGTAGSAAASLEARSLGVLFLFAILGGLVLNLMPCVFPVLSIKAIGLVEQAKKHPAAVRAKGLVFAAGVISSMLSLAAVLLVMRAGGEQIGWGFQLQSPLFVTLMVYLLLTVGLNLSGVFEFGSSLAGIGDGLTQGDSYRASFFTGVLTTLVATPCTAPFMAAAVGAALTQSASVALGIFATLGLGLALPYLVLSFAPWLRRALPRPGPWMDTLKQVFAFPMYASAAWLLWVLAQQSATAGLAAAFAGSVLIALSAWAYQKSKVGSKRSHVLALATAAGAALLAVMLPVQVARESAAAVPRGAAQPARTTAWQPYDAARVAELKTAGKPLLINFTASWCLTCLFNERNAFEDAAVLALFHGKGVTLIKGDWTNRDPAITAALASFGRAGVPLYVIYNAKPGSAEPVILPQLLSAGAVQDALGALPNREFD